MTLRIESLFRSDREASNGTHMKSWNKLLNGHDGLAEGVAARISLRPLRSKPLGKWGSWPPDLEVVGPGFAYRVTSNEAFFPKAEAA